jgi:hypothetical protein
MLAEIMFYSIVQKEGLGFDKCVEEAKARMSRYNVTVCESSLAFGPPFPRPPLVHMDHGLTLCVPFRLVWSRVRSPTC